jgi:hypothetical protein
MSNSAKSVRVEGDGSRADFPLHFSNLKHMAKSPAHFRASLAGRADSAAMRLGRICHAVLLGGESVQVFDGDRRGKAWTEFKAAHEGDEIATVTEYETACAVRDSVKAHPAASTLLASAAFETEIAWRHPLGIYCNSRIDILRPGSVIDFKTCGDANPATFVWRAARMGYHAQLSFYADAIEASGQPRPERFVLIAAETAPPYAVVPFELDPAAKDQGARMVRAWIERLRGCLETNEWPAYCDATMPFTVPLDADLYEGDEP